MLLKNVEISIILNIREMRQQVLKALANPARIFYVPYYLAILNFFVLFSIYMATFVITLVIDFHSVPNPLYFLVTVIAIHVVLMGFSRKEPQLANIIIAKIQLFKQKIPSQMVV